MLMPKTIAAALSVASCVFVKSHCNFSSAALAALKSGARARAA